MTLSSSVHLSSLLDSVQVHVVSLHIDFLHVAERKTTTSSPSCSSNSVTQKSRPLLFYLQTENPEEMPTSELAPWLK